MGGTMEYNATQLATSVIMETIHIIVPTVPETISITIGITHLTIATVQINMLNLVKPIASHANISVILAALRPHIAHLVQQSKE